MAGEQSRQSGGNGAMWFILGALVIAVGVLGYLYMGGDAPVAGSGDGGSVNVTVDNSDSSEAPAADGADAPATTTAGD